MIARVLDALADSAVSRTVAVVSPHAPATTRTLNDRLADETAGPCRVIEATGEGYVTDLSVGLEAVGGVAVT